MIIELTVNQIAKAVEKYMDDEFGPIVGGVISINFHYPHGSDIDNPDDLVARVIVERGEPKTGVGYIDSTSDRDTADQIS